MFVETATFATGEAVLVEVVDLEEDLEGEVVAAVVVGRLFVVLSSRRLGLRAV